jgi:hypothetical protein
MIFNKKIKSPYSNEFYRLLARLILDPTFRNLISSVKTSRPGLESAVKTGGFNINDEEYEVLENIDYLALGNSSTNQIYTELPLPNKIRPVDVLP